MVIGDDPQEEVLCRLDSLGQQQFELLLHAPGRLGAFKSVGFSHLERVLLA